MEGAFLIDALEGVRTEEITLSLDQSGWQALCTQGIVVGERGRKYRCWQTQLGSGDDNATPWIDEIGKLTLEVRVQNQSRQLRIGVISFADTIQEFRTDDAAAAPNGREIAWVNIPVVLVRTSLDEVKALGVSNQLGSIKCAADVFDKVLAGSTQRVEINSGTCW